MLLKTAIGESYWLSGGEKSTRMMTGSNSTSVVEGTGTWRGIETVSYTLW